MDTAQSNLNYNSENILAKERILTWNIWTITQIINCKAHCLVKGVLMQFKIMKMEMTVSIIIIIMRFIIFYTKINYNQIDINLNHIYKVLK